VSNPKVRAPDASLFTDDVDLFIDTSVVATGYFSKFGRRRVAAVSATVTSDRETAPGFFAVDPAEGRVVAFRVMANLFRLVLIDICVEI